MEEIKKSKQNGTKLISRCKVCDSEFCLCDFDKKQFLNYLDLLGEHRLIHAREKTFVSKLFEHKFVN